jgi:hypothetical protein
VIFANQRLSVHGLKKISHYLAKRSAGIPTAQLELFFQDKASGILVDGQQLVAQYQVLNSDTLLVLDENCPFEELLYFYLVRDGAVIEQIRYGAPYTPGIFEEVRLEQQRLLFSFASDEIIALEILPTASFWLPQQAPGSCHKGKLLQPMSMSLTVTDTVLK